VTILLEVAISMAFVYTLLSILVTYVTEVWQRWKKTRGVLLRKSLERLLNDELNKNFCELLYEHPLIRAQRRDDDHKPSYLSSALFVSAFTDILRREAVRPRIFMTTDGTTHIEEPTERNQDEDLRYGILSLAHSPLKVQLLSLMNEAQAEKALMNRLAFWYDEFQQEVSSRFKHLAKIKTMVISVIVAVAMNVDSISLVGSLYKNQEMRTLVVNASEQWLKENPVLPSIAANDSTDSPPISSREHFQEVKTQMDSLAHYLGEFGLPIGWSQDECAQQARPDAGATGFWRQIKSTLSCKYTTSTMSEMVLTLLGWFITATALSFGAPFWFDLLNRFVSMRSGRPRPQPMNPNA